MSEGEIRQFVEELGQFCLQAPLWWHSRARAMWHSRHSSQSFYSCLVLIENCTVMSLIACLSDDVVVPVPVSVPTRVPMPGSMYGLSDSVFGLRAPRSTLHTQHATRSHTSRPHALAARCLINIPESCLFEISSCLSYFSLLLLLLFCVCVCGLR